MIKLAEILSLAVLDRAQIVAGTAGLEREVRWVHVIDMPDVLSWVQPGQFLLTTAYGWPREAEAQRALIRGLAERNLACVGLAVPKFFEHFPEAACEEAERVALPLLEIPWDVPFARITEAVHGLILAEQSRVIEQSEAIHRTLTQAAVEAESLQDLATTLGMLINRAITIEDMEGGVLADHALELEEDEARRTTRLQEKTPPKLQAYLEQSGYLRTVRAAHKPVHIPALPEFGFAERLVCPIRLKGELIGLVWIIEGARPLSELDVRAAEHAAIIAALHIAHKRELAAFEARLGFTFLDSLLEGRFEATPQALERAHLLGFDPNVPYRVGLLILDEPLPLSREGFLQRERFAEQLTQRLKFLSISPLLSVSLNRIYFLLPEHCSGERIWKSIARDGVSLAFGKPHAGIEGIQTSYREVLSLLGYLPANSFHYYETLLLPRVLLGDQEAQHAFLEQLLGCLKQQRNGEVLVETLLVWAQVGFHPVSAAQQLHVHAKTLQYRLARAAQLSGLDFADPEIRFQLQLASHLLFFQGKKFR